MRRAPCCVLIVDDEASIRFTLQEVLGDRGHPCLEAASGEAALERLEDCDVVITDLSMPGMDGMTLLHEIRARDPELPVIMLTARGSERTAVQAMKAGAFDYLNKPFDIDEVALVVARAGEVRDLRQRGSLLEVERVLGKAIIGDSATMKKLIRDATRVASRDVTVLISGETGTGKELIATLLHVRSARSGGPHIRFNCAAIVAPLAEAELFGHVRGAFTGADRDRAGYATQADGGTLILDEIGEMPLAIQASLLRLAQEGEVQPVGARKVQKVDVRLVSCSHRDLRAAAAVGTFREDLYYRLAVVELRVPPLRERRADIPDLVECFRARYADRFGLEDTRFTAELREQLTAAPWPGNVRELENTVARLLALSAGGEIGVDALTIDRAATVPGTSFRAQLAAFEKDLIERTLRECAGNQSEAARRLEMTRVTLIDKMKRHGLHKKHRS